MVFRHWILPVLAFTGILSIAAASGANSTDKAGDTEGAGLRGKVPEYKGPGDTPPPPGWGDAYAGSCPGSLPPVLAAAASPFKIHGYWNFVEQYSVGPVGPFVGYLVKDYEFTVGDFHCLMAAIALGLAPPLDANGNVIIAIKSGDDVHKGGICVPGSPGYGGPGDTVTSLDGIPPTVQYVGIWESKYFNGSYAKNPGTPTGLPVTSLSFSSWVSPGPPGSIYGLYILNAMKALVGTSGVQIVPLFSPTTSQCVKAEVCFQFKAECVQQIINEWAVSGVHLSNSQPIFRVNMESCLPGSGPSKPYQGDI